MKSRSCLFEVLTMTFLLLGMVAFLRGNPEAILWGVLVIIMVILLLLFPGK